MRGAGGCARYCLACRDGTTDRSCQRNSWTGSRSDGTGRRGRTCCRICAQLLRPRAAVRGGDVSADRRRAGACIYEFEEGRFLDNAGSILQVADAGQFSQDAVGSCRLNNRLGSARTIGTVFDNITCCRKLVGGWLLALLVSSLEDQLQAALEVKPQLEPGIPVDNRNGVRYIHIARNEGQNENADEPGEKVLLSQVNAPL